MPFYVSTISRKSLISAISIIALGSMLVACGGGGGGASVPISQAPADGFSGTVAMGAPVANAEISLEDLDGQIESTISDAMGGWIIPFSKVGELNRALKPPFIVKAKFTIAGHEINLFSISTDDAGNNVTMNITPVTDLITRAYVWPSFDDPNLVEGLSNDPGRLSLITSSVKAMLGPLSPSGIDDFIKDEFTPDPVISDYDALLERIQVGHQNGNVVIADMMGVPMATESFENLAANAIGDTDAETVTAAEAEAAEARRGDFPTTTSPYVNESANGEPAAQYPDVLPAPANLIATKTGDLSWEMSWSAVAGAKVYFVYQQRGAAPSVPSGIYDQESGMPFLSVSGNATKAHYHVDTEGKYFWAVVAVSANDVPDEGEVFPKSHIGVPSNLVSLTFGSENVVLGDTYIYSDLDAAAGLCCPELAAGQSVQLKVGLRHSDGAEEEISSGITWSVIAYSSSADTLNLSLSDSGLLSAYKSYFGWFGVSVRADFVLDGAPHTEYYIFYEPRG